MAPNFGWFQLRTTNTNAAGAFYPAVTGLTLRGDVLHAADTPVANITQLPERAAALGAPAHWLGHIGVSDVDAVAQRMIAAGGAALGPQVHTPRGDRIAALRDPFGAVLALSTRTMESNAAVPWHELHTPDRERAWALYSELFGWSATEAIELGPDVGTYQMFAWSASGTSVGAMINTARLPHIHPHWLFYFAVIDIDVALAATSAGGGKVINGPLELSDGDRIAQCEDPQGAAFALHQCVSHR